MSLYKLVTTENVDLNYNAFKKSELIECVVDLRSIYFRQKEENQILKKQLEEYQEELEKADSITQSCIFNGKKESGISYRKCLNMLEKRNNQQKKFIEYLTHELNTSYTNSSRYYYFSLILSKYKEIIEVK